ncbi:ATP-dependent nuclease [Sphingobacterium deserti]|uniref:Uncharacterized protein n=1 Tax=Sphingobacterium deserti TaxID=1229276 RepID=A0A0B8T7Q1_9SPHI|nr:AAA family ATPase [Sphingobacterium deserti]KGE13785.1 hypothetical protein DI53_2411 [Sphingobacterium deserti]
MLERISLKNFRCFDDHEVEFKGLSVIVGKNNAGKSTLIEALRLVSLAIGKFRTSNFSPVPNWLDLEAGWRGIKPSVKNLDLNISNIFHQYSEAPAIITAYFDNKIVCNVYIGDSLELFCTLIDQDGKYVNNKKVANDITFQTVSILPHLSTLEKDEKVLMQDYVRQNLATNLSSRHFRNQISLFPQYFDQFKNLAEGSWPGVKLFPILEDDLNREIVLSLMVQDYNFVSEVGWLGSGLQMWLQIMWFLSRVDRLGIVILDEPDVYMHPDLQRKLIRLLKSSYSQVIVATHSIEIISEVEPENIIVIDKKLPKSLFANDKPFVQNILNSIGSIHNLELTRLWSSKRLLILEGNDLDLLSPIYNKLFPISNEPIDTIPKFDIGGWGGWAYARGSNMLLKSNIDRGIQVYCIFDSDYHTKSDIELRYEESSKAGINLHIWSRKEIENYLVVPTLIHRYIKKNSRGKKITLSNVDIEDKINEIVGEMKDNLINSLADEIHKSNRGYSISKCRQLAIESIISPVVHRVSGKELISRISTWCQKEFNVCISPKRLALELHINEIAEEVRIVINAIENSMPFKR